MLKSLGVHTIPRSCSPAPRRCFTTVGNSNTAPRKDPFRALLFGADRFSCTVLRALIGADKNLFKELIIVTPHPTRKDKNLKNVYIPPLHSLAEKLSLPAISLPAEGLRDWVPPPGFDSPSDSTLLITASFGHLIPTSLLSRFDDLHAINIHPSLLPQYRGAAPIQWTIMNGDTVSGVTVQELSRESFDKGRLLAQSSMRVPEAVDYSELELILANQGAELLVKVLQNWEAAKANASPQDGNEATLAPKLKKQYGRIDWSSLSAQQIDRLRRGVSHQIPLTTFLSTSSTPLQIQLAPFPRQTELESDATQLYLASPAGTAFYSKALKGIIVRTSGDGPDGLAIIEKTKPAGKKWMAAGEWWNGVQRQNDTILFQ